MSDREAPGRPRADVPEPETRGNGAPAPRPDARASAEERRARLAAILRARAREPRTSPVSFAQRRLWLLDQLTPGTAAYNLPLALRLRGPVDAAALQRAFDVVVARHEALRTTFAVRDREPVQVIAVERSVPLVEVDLTALDEAEREPEAKRLAGREARRPFDLAAGPLVRVTLFRLGPTDHLLVGVAHHIVADGWSNGIFARELATAYGALATGRDPALPDLPIQYADFAAWERRHLSGAALDDALAYWRARLAGLTPLVLPSDRPPPALRTGDGATHPVRLRPEVTTRLKALARGEGVTLFMVLLAGFQALLQRYARQDDIAVGVPVAGRDRAELAGVIGCFVNTVVIRTDCGGDPGFRELLQRARAAALGATEQQGLPFERLVEALQPERVPGRLPLAPVLFTFQSGLLAPPPSTPTVDVQMVECDAGTAKADLALELSDLDGEIRGRVEYSTELFDAATAARMARHLELLFERAVAEPDRPLSGLSLLEPADEARIGRWNATAVPRAEPAALHALIADQAARTPDACAVVCGERSLTYRELARRARGLAGALRARGLGADGVAGVCMERSLELAVVLLAVLEAGGAYLPLEPGLPPERLAFMAADARARLIVGPARFRERVPGWDGAAWVAVGEGDAPDAVSPGDAVAFAPGPAGAGDDRLAYVIYTSGSTGAPKGAMNTHRAIVNRLLWMQETYSLGPRDRVLHKTPLGFDVSVWELFWPLMAGATLVVARPGGHRDPAYLRHLVAEQGVTVAHFVPTMLQAFLGEPGIEAACRSLRHVFASGEALSPALARRCAARIRAPLHNLYGPTEAAVDVSAFTCVRDGVTQAGSVPIGRPIANTQLHVLDGRLRPVPVGLAGELYIGGVALARGYAGRPDLTAERFLPDPRGAPGARIYRTGDLARWRDDGVLEFRGRVDHQVKLGGQRVELGEVESALARLPGVREAAAAVREAAGGPRLVGYVVGDGRATSAELRGALRRALPEYMVPSAIVALPALPLTPSGKVDRRALPEPGAAAAEPGTAAVAPRTPTEAALAGIWSDVLGVAPVGAQDNFFDLGGASIQCLHAVARAQEAGLPVTAAMMFEHQTVAELAAAVERA